MSSSSYIDSLPYHDKQLDDPAIKAAALALIEAELRKTKQINDDDERLPKSVDVFPKSKELSELLNKYPNNTIKGIDPTKYQPPILSDQPTLEELELAEKQSKIGEAHMALRLENSTILSTYGSNAWLIRNYQLNSQISELTKVSEDLKEKIIDLNRSRRVYQEDQGLKLSKLEGKWQDSIGSTVQLELACNAMNLEVAALREKEERLQKEVDELEK
ncbi:uncharacterized protein L201_006264 [Kwoniella dendrophila CBS 6074]|uniref:Pre-mRNA-splicing factor SPF27 n=1 Tax=Kwoniella dendrophila CBS 6074 TaxID=1295534 RepID=A0AAX4K0R8_9TREE